MAEKEKEKEKGKEKVEEAPPEKKSSMKWIVIAVVVLLVLGGGGFVSWKTFLSPAQEDDKKEEKPVRVQLGPTFPLEMFIASIKPKFISSVIILYKIVSVSLSLLTSVSKFMNINLLKSPGNSIFAGTRVSIYNEVNG